LCFFKITIWKHKNLLFQIACNWFFFFWKRRILRLTSAVLNIKLRFYQIPNCAFKNYFLKLHIFKSTFWNRKSNRIINLVITFTWKVHAVGSINDRRKEKTVRNEVNGRHWIIFFFWFLHFSLTKNVFHSLLNEEYCANLMN